MYEQFFSFSASPFRLNPDPKFFFGSKSHNKAMAYLHYGLRQAEGFIVITGEIGAGKSMLIGHLIDQLDRSNVVAAHLLTTSLEPSALLSHILSAFRIEPAGIGKSAEIEAFEDFLFDQMNRGRRVLLIVDEAQNLPVRTIEELRMLSNMDYDGTPLFQVFLVGQPEFKAVLSKSNMEQFRQRVIASYHLESLNLEETTEYIRHRMAVVGWTADPSVSDEAFKAIYNATGGLPRKINKLCNRILLHCSIEEIHAVDEVVVNVVASDLKEENLEKAASNVPQGEAVGTTMEKSLKGKKHSKKKAATRKNASSTELTLKNERKAVRDEVHEAEKAPESKPSVAPVVIPFGAVRKITKTEPAKAVHKTADPEPDGQMTYGCEEEHAEAAPAKMEIAENTLISAESAAEHEGAADRIKNVTNEVKPSVDDTPPVQRDDSHLSVLDRLRARRNEPEQVVNANESETAPSVATLKDVANAIAAASATEQQIAQPGDIIVPFNSAAEIAVKDVVDDAAGLGEPAWGDDPKGWRQSVVKSISETRDELKTAHANVSLLRRRLSDIDKNRRERRGRIIANLTRAESLLTEIRNAWR